MASWRPFDQSRSGAIKIVGSPFRSFAEAEETCNIMLKNLKD
jgi:hypothetical protein